MVDKYEKLKKIGEGGFGKVFLVQDPSNMQLLVMKEIDLLKVDAKGKAEALHEVKFLSQFRHPNIIEYKDYFQTKGRTPVLCIVMAYADGMYHYIYIYINTAHEPSLSLSLYLHKHSHFTQYSLSPNR